jgi:hypothetical protein
MAGNIIIAELPVGQQGLNGSKNQSQVPIDSLIYANNLTFEAGTLQKEGGAAKMNDTAVSGAPEIIGAWDWHPTNTAQRTIIMANDGFAYRTTATAFVAMSGATDLTVSGDVVPFFVEGGDEVAANNKKLFMFSRENAVRVIDGDALVMTSLASGPADWASASNSPSFGLNHVGRLWGGGNKNDPHRLYYSTTSNHEEFGTANGGGSIAIYPGDGNRLVAAVSFKGFIMAFKEPAGVYAVDTRDATVANWRVDKLNDNVGAAGPRTAVVIDNDVLYMDRAGQLHLISRVNDGTFDAQNLSQSHDLLPLMEDEFNLGQAYFVRGVYYWAKREAHFAMAGLGDTTNTRRLVVDFNARQPRFRISDRDVAQDLFLREDSDNVPRLAMGDASGFIWNLDQATRSADGGGYDGQWQTPHMDLTHVDPSLGGRRKNGRFLELVIEPTGNFDISVDVLWDGKITQTVHFNLGSTGASIGSFILGTDLLGGGEVETKRKRITGSGRRIALIGRNSGDSENFSIARAFLHFTPGNQRVQKF